MSIPDNLTYEQFTTYAERQPSLEGDWLYGLQHKKPCHPLGGPEFGLCMDEYMFLTFKDAENYISELIKDGSGGTWCFNIQQIPIGGNSHQHGAEWLYDRNGNLVDYTNTTWNEDNSIKSTFFGRPDSRIRFHKGDIVFVEDRGMVHPAVIASEGPTVDRFWKFYNIRKERRKDIFDYSADASDDCYYVLNGPGDIYHAHIPPTSIMPYNGNVPHDIKAYFTRCLEFADKGENDMTAFIDQCGPIDSDMTTLSTTRIGIVYDHGAQRHRLVIKNYDCITDCETIKALPGDLNENHLSLLKDWLTRVKYAKTRLWYIIREWDLCNEDLDAHLPLSTTVDELLCILPETAAE